MMKNRLDGGVLRISNEVFTTISGCAAQSCFGVKGMVARNAADGLVQLLRRDSYAKGVRISVPEGGKLVDIDLHIAIEHGVNIPALCKSIMSEVRYHVERTTGMKVGAVNIFIDSIMAS